MSLKYFQLPDISISSFSLYLNIYMKNMAQLKQSGMPHWFGHAPLGETRGGHWPRFIFYKLHF